MGDGGYIPVGIDSIRNATGSCVLSLDDLADARDIPRAKFSSGLGQDEMSVLAPHEDVITMAAEACRSVLEAGLRYPLRTLIFATESGVDQSKAGAVFLHRLLGLDPRVRALEVKQACYGATGALILAAALCRANPTESVLVVASDNARYELLSGGEPTQGAGAVAMLVTSNPRVLELDPVSGLHTSDVDDFWRPNYRSTAVVDGKLSVDAYLDAVRQCWRDYTQRGGFPLGEIERICFHQPFTKMARKAYTALVAEAGDGDDTFRRLNDTLDYNRRIGNSYTASVYFALANVLEQGTLRDGDRVGLFSYGSGCVAEFTSGRVVDIDSPGIDRSKTIENLERRTPITVADYELIHKQLGETEEVLGAVNVRPRGTASVRVGAGGFRYLGTYDHVRRYEKVR
ncbi:hydroxymethylglutaryl-CoA synthase [Nocardia arizonensis]|uniref:hydroxymethylglutaryl-CoA synthase n=1 Tax=Nocardia arizonensis TaxID=1141647 RepID=UPI0006D24620|nr:hydroxymethylglutaryl-CoA synthase [Nocardia arizonensis]